MEPAPARLEVDFYSVHPPHMWAHASPDGNGYAFGPAELHRDWMERTASKYAYRCLPLTIMNQTGFWVRNPIGFTALWHGEPDRIEFAFDGGVDHWKSNISNHFSNGIISFNSPVIVRTRPRGSRLLVGPPPNVIKPYAQGLCGLVETDWSVVSFTMNWRITVPEVEVRFERGEPIMHLLPLARNACADLEEGRIVFRSVDDDPGVAAEYRAFCASRDHFLAAKDRGEIGHDEWQKHYFRGVRLTGEPGDTEHFTKVKIDIVNESGKAVDPSTGSGRTEDGRPARAPPDPSTSSGRTGPAAARAEPAPSTGSGTGTGSGKGTGSERAVAEFGGLRLRALRLHPRAARLAPAHPAPGAPALGWHLYPPLDLDAVWYGGRSFDWKALTPFGDEEAEALARIAAHGGDGGPPPYEPRRKLDFGGAGEGAVEIWTGLLLETPPGWALEVRPVAGADASPIFAAEGAVLDTDRGPRDLTVRLRFRQTDRWAHLRGADPETSRPIAHLAPLGREALDQEWLCGQMPIEASRDALELLRRWAGAPAPLAR